MACSQRNEKATGLRFSSGGCGLRHPLEPHRLRPTRGGEYYHEPRAVSNRLL